MIIPANEIVDFLASVITDRQRSPEDKSRAAKALAYYSVKEDEANAATERWEAANAEAVKAGQPESSPETLELQRRAILGYGREGARMLWYTPSDCVFSSYTGTDGVAHQTVTSKRFGGIRPDEFYEFNPSQSGVLGRTRVEDVIPDVDASFGRPTFTPAVPLPVLQVTETEITARKETFKSLDERYAPSAVADRVKAVEREAAEFRTMRDQPNSPLPVIQVAPIPPSDIEKKAIAGIKIIPASAEKLAKLQADGVKPLSSVEVIAAQIAEEQDVRARYAASQETLTRLKQLRNSQPA